MATVTGMTGMPEPAGPRQWTPGAGVERLRREMPHLVPSEITDEDRARAEEIIAAGNAADERRGGQRAA
jgi:hypothetical protein